jgi:signal transduction histidine kinase
MKPIRFIRTASFKLAALYVVLFGISSLVVFGIVYWLTLEALYKQTILSVEGEWSALNAVYRKGYEKELAGKIKQRMGSGKHPFVYYLLQDTNGRKLAGNFPGMTPFNGLRKVLAPHPDAIGGNGKENSKHRALTLGGTLSDGFFLAVGNSMYQSDESEEAIGAAFFWAMGAVLLLALGGGAVLSIGFLHRIDEINRTAHAIIEGHFTERIRTSGADDEFDQLAVNLNNMLDRIQALMESLQQVSSNIAHDLRTPLGRLRQNLESARRESRSIDAYEKAVDWALVDADSILATFGSLLRIAQIEATTRRASFQSVDLSAVFQSVADTYAPVAEDMDKRIVTRIAPGLAIRGDRELLVQMLANLVENALKHTPRGTTIQVMLDRNPEGGPEKGPVGRVADDGPGIPENERDKIFDRFYRLEASRSASGNGLGLALVKAVAELHGARIAITDNHQGAVFKIAFMGASGLIADAS